MQQVTRWIVSFMVGMALAVSVPVSPVSAAPKAGDVKAAPAGKVDLNTASQAELEKLPGVGPAAAKKIIAGRPYKSVADLSKAGVPAKTVEKITPMVAVGGAPAAAPAAPAKVPEPKAAMPAKAPATPAPQAAAPAKAAKPVVPPPAGKDMVWVNTDSKIYHKPGSKWYGKTKTGSYMTEAEAVKAGFRAAKGGSKEQ
ncbi:MAG: helix-hairpin-helix domain-containing protein [Desulfuromonadales bacterium]|nr:MAG: helix-hairpin-helix domain-containing protein [Desulfuromonadales bacterium]